MVKYPMVWHAAMQQPLCRLATQLQAENNMLLRTQGGVIKAAATVDIAKHAVRTG
jgi:hypothetical protein